MSGPTSVATPEPSPDVSIVLLTHEAGPNLERVLDAVFTQEKAPPFEVIAIDTASSDGTLERLARWPVRVERIARDEFSHPGTRNRAVRLARGEVVVFLVQDAIPAHPRWLANLVAALDDPRVAAAYSRQIPRAGANPIVRRDIERGAPPTRRVTRIDDTEPFLVEEYRRHPLAFIAFSHVASCARRRLLLEHPLDERLPMVEDQEWCRRILEAGWTVVYEPSSVVVHSHEHRLAELYRRQADYGRSFAGFLPLPTSLTKAVAGAAYEALGDWISLCGLEGSLTWKLRWAAAIPVRRLAMKLGFHRGLRTKTATRS